MIIVEETLKDLFATLPTIEVDGSTYPINFDFGNHPDLLRYLDSKRKEGGKIYPLIWLETPLIKIGKDNRPLVRDLKLILATLSKSTLSNTERLEVTFKPTLIPLHDNVLKALAQSGSTELRNKDNKKTSFHYNYTEDNETFADQFWDVIVLKHDVQFNNCPLKTINY